MLAVVLVILSGKREPPISGFGSRVDGAVSDPEARYFGGRVEEHSLVPLGGASLGRIGFDKWLRRSQAAAWAEFRDQAPLRS
jgi:hypothetical protein